MRIPRVSEQKLKDSSRGKYKQVLQRLWCLLWKMLDTQNSKENPQVRSGNINIFLKCQGVGLRTLLKIHNKGQMSAAPEDRCKLMGGEAASLTNPDNGCTDKRNINTKSV